MSELVGKPGLTPGGSSLNMQAIVQLKQGASLENFTRKVSAFIAKTALPIEPPPTANFISGADKNGDKALDSGEWAALGAPWPYPQGSDGNKDGKLDASELAPSLSANMKSSADRRSMHFTQLAKAHYFPEGDRDVQPRLYILGGASLLILLLASANFINLLVARSVQRGKEVAIRKVAGAKRAVLVFQFLGESLFQAVIALCLALALLEFVLPAINDFLQSGATLDYWRDPALLASLAGGTVLIGVAAGFYPAIILSGFRPASVLKGLLRVSPVGDRLREILVALQFAVLIALLISAATVFQQNQFATTEALKVDTDQVLLIKLKSCDRGLRDRIAAVPGVRALVCTSNTALPRSGNSCRGARPLHTDAPGAEQGHVSMCLVSAEPGFFELYGLKPRAGRFLGPASGQYVINDTARRKLGYATPQAAIGKLMILNNGEYSEEEKRGPVPPDQLYPMKGTIVGVVQDFTLDPRNDEIASTAYGSGTITGYLNQPLSALLHVKLNGRELSQSVAAIDKAWKQGNNDPIDRFFLDARIQELQIAVTRQGQLFAAFAGLAMVLASLGLFGIALSIVTRRTKEIGVRKAMGASTTDIIRLLLWQFAKPILWANVVALPLAWYSMNRWLSDFAYRIDLDWRVFVGALLATLTIALLTVAAQSVATARAVPATALRYE
jgi:putative ABC transport system permease protein